MHKPLIIAHRGASSTAPENTLAAFAEAVRVGAEGIEFDVRLTRDGEAVVFHDEDLLRIAGRELFVNDFTARELKGFDVGSWFDKTDPDRSVSRFGGERIPTLRETLDFLHDYKGVVYIELKCRESDVGRLSEAVGEAIGDSPLFPQIIVKSFNLDVLPEIRRHCPEVRTATLFAPKVMILLRKEKRLINIAGELNADLLSLHFSLATKKLIKKAGKRGLKVAIWTADSPRWIKRGINLGIDHIITNNPARLLDKRRKFFPAE
jgi:glycerophosphoryl diester phosphodiesterase